MRIALTDMMKVLWKRFWNVPKIPSLASGRDRHFYWFQ